MDYQIFTFSFKFFMVLFDNVVKSSYFSFCLFCTFILFIYLSPIYFLFIDANLEPKFR